MAWRIMRTASGSSMLGLLRWPSAVGRRMQPKPSAEAFQSRGPNFRYCMVELYLASRTGFYSRPCEEIEAPGFFCDGRSPGLTILNYLGAPHLVFVRELGHPANLRQDEQLN